MSVGKFRVDDFRHWLLPGRPADYLNTAVFDERLRNFLAQPDCMLAVLKDEVPLPTTAAREGYFDDRHLEFWLSGWRDATTTLAALPEDGASVRRLLDFGGASGRVVRHYQAKIPGAECYLSDVNPRHIGLVKSMFGGRVLALQNHGIPSLPFPDGFFDLITAFSVFTHIDADDTAWLLELRRITRPGGTLYITIHDQETWTKLPDTVLAGVSLANADFRRYRDENATLNGRVVHVYNDSAVYNCNVFLGEDYISRTWAPLFAGYELCPAAHDHQAALVLRVP